MRSNGLTTEPKDLVNKVKNKDKRALVDLEVETALIEKYSLEKQDVVVNETNSVPIAVIAKQAIVDDILINNKNYHKTRALKKRLWVGEEGGAFAMKDLREYYKVYDQTQLNKVAKYI